MCWARHKGGLRTFRRGAHVYMVLHSTACAGNIKTANCNFFDTTGTPTEQKSGSKVILRENLESSNRTFDSACKLSFEKPENWVFTASLGLLYSLAPDEKPFPRCQSPSSRVVASCPTCSKKRQPCINKKKERERQRDNGSA
jgi:hypothetical protein